MATPRDIRRLAFQAIFQLDASEQSDPSIAPMDAEDPAGIRAWLAAYADENASKLRPAEIEKALSLAQDAFADRRAADDAIRRHAPTWPAVRQPAVDRAILRLAHYEITQLNLDPRIAINEAVELAKAFSTERSPGFVNALLDKVKREHKESKAASVPTEHSEEQD